MNINLKLLYLKIPNSLNSIFCFSLYIIFCFILNLVLSFKLYSYDKNFALKGGASLAHLSLSSQDQSKNGLSAGIHTAFGYRVLPWEFNLASQFVFGKIGRDPLFGSSTPLNFTANQQGVRTQGDIRIVSFSPQLKYFFKYKIKKWRFYSSLGPLWSQMTMNLQPFTDTNGDKQNDSKITFTNLGAYLAIGFEETSLSKDNNPAYIELAYSFGETRSMRLVDISDQTEVQEISSERSPFDVFGHTVSINVGLTIF